MILQFIQFCGAGLCGFGIDVLIFTILINGGLSAALALALSYPCGTTTNFLLCKRYVFSSNRTMGNLAIRYGGVALLVFCANQALLPSMVYFFPQSPSMVRISAAAAVSILQYFLLRFGAFGL